MNALRSLLSALHAGLTAGRRADRRHPVQEFRRLSILLATDPTPPTQDDDLTDRPEETR